MLVALAIALMIFINAFYVSAEFSTVSARRTRVAQLAAEGNRLALLLQPILADPRRLDHYVATCQHGITASSLLLGFFGQSWLAGALQPLLVDRGGLQEAASASIAATGVLLFLTALQVLLGELVPKSVGIRFPERLALLTVMPMRWSTFILNPLTLLFNGAAQLIVRLLRVQPIDGDARTHRPEEIEMLVAESAKGGLLDAEEKVMLLNILRLSGLVAHQVMIPRPRIEAAPADMDCSELLALIADSPYTRIPIYEGDTDHILGIVHLKDLFRVCLVEQDQEPTVRDLLREVPFVPETLPVEELWSLLRADRQYMAIVFDEYGGTAGLVTLEDLIEEVFGEFQDEFDQEGPLISRGSAGETVLRADVLVTDVNEYLFLNLPTDRGNTVGGLVTSLLGCPAQVGDEVTIGALSLCVRQVDDLAVTRVSMTLPDDRELTLDGQRAEKA